MLDLYPDEEAPFGVSVISDDKYKEAQWWLNELSRLRAEFVCLSGPVIDNIEE